MYSGSLCTQGSCQIWLEIPRRYSSVFMPTKTSVTIQGNITTMRYQNDVIRAVLLIRIHANLGMMLAGLETH